MHTYITEGNIIVLTDLLRPTKNQWKVSYWGSWYRTKNYHLLETYVRPAVETDAGNIAFDSLTKVLWPSSYKEHALDVLLLQPLKGWNRSDAQTYVARSKRSRRARWIAIILGIAFEMKASGFSNQKRCVVNDCLMGHLWLLLKCIKNSSNLSTGNIGCSEFTMKGLSGV